MLAQLVVLMRTPLAAARVCEAKLRVLGWPTGRLLLSSCCGAIQPSCSRGEGGRPRKKHGREAEAGAALEGRRTGARAA